MKKGPNNLPWELHDPAPEPPVWMQPVDLSDHMPAENVLPRPFRRNVWNCDTAAVPWA